MRLCRQILILRLRRGKASPSEKSIHLRRALLLGNARQMKRLEDSVVTAERDLKLLREILERI